MEDLDDQKSKKRGAFIRMFSELDFKYEAAGAAGRQGVSRLSGSGSAQATGKKRAAGDAYAAGSGNTGG